MTEQTPPNLAPQPTELEILKERAKVMGITHSNNIGVEALRQKIQDRLEGKADEPEAPAAPQVNPFTMAKDVEQLAQVIQEEPVRVMSIREYMLKEHTKLIRLRITNLDPKKKDIPGEILTVANEYLGTIRKYIPYGEATENGFHVPYCIYEFMKTRKFVSVNTRKDPKTGHITVTNRDVAEYSLEVLDPLTTEELRELAVAQMAAGSVD